MLGLDLGRPLGGQAKGCAPAHACATPAHAGRVVSSLANPTPSAPEAAGRCSDSVSFLPSHPRAVHSAKNILEDISNMFDDLADQLDAMLD